MKTWLVPLNELTREQRDAVELNTRQHRLIGGAPGSGKTQILLHRARHLLDTTGADAARLRVFIYTNVLADYLRTALPLLNLPAACISTFYLWCRDYYQQHVSRKLPWDAEAKAFNWQAILQGVWNCVRTLGEGQRPYDFVLVDEGQDLDPVSFDILKAIARHVTVCIDHKQQIYDHGASEPDIVKRLGLAKSNVTLLAVFRCSPYIVELAARFLRDTGERTAFIRQNLVPTTEKEVPLLYVADDLEDERARLIDLVKTRQAVGEQIGILLPKNAQVFSFARELTEAGLEVEIRQEGWRKEHRFPPLDFRSERPKLLTYYSAKGLTFDSVLLPRLVPGSFRRATSTETDHLLFVGATRATRWVFMSTVQGRGLLNMDEMRELERDGKLAIQTRRDTFGGRPTPARPAPQPARPKSDEEGIGDLL